MLVSKLMLGVKYSRIHYIGVAASFVGLSCMVVSDLMQDNKGQDYPIKSMIAGDFMALGGIILFSMYGKHC